MGDSVSGWQVRCGEVWDRIQDWHILSSSFGHDKALEIRPYANLPDDKRPILFYAGDGVSDLSAAKETDLLFAKAGRGELGRAFYIPMLIYNQIS